VEPAECNEVELSDAGDVVVDVVSLVDLPGGTVFTSSPAAENMRIYACH